MKRRSFALGVLCGIMIFCRAAGRDSFSMEKFFRVCYNILYIYVKMTCSLSEHARDSELSRGVGTIDKRRPT